jgi:hypothetical protein
MAERARRCHLERGVGGLEMKLPRIGGRAAAAAISRCGGAWMGGMFGTDARTAWLLTYT